MGIHLDVGNFLAVKVELSKSAAPISDVYALASGIVAKVIGIVPVFQSFQELQRSTVKDFDRAILPIGYVQSIIAADIQRALRLLEAGDCLYTLSGVHVDYLDRIVAQC